MLDIVERRAAPTGGVTAPARAPARLQLNVIYTGPSGSRGALAAALELGHGLDAHVTLIAAQVVPYPLSLDEPAVSATFIHHELSQVLAGLDVDIDVQLLLCRDRSAAIRHALAPKSLIILGGRARWWRTSAERLARSLQQDGHIVIFLDSLKYSAGPLTAPALEKVHI